MEHVTEERGFARATRAGDHDETSEREAQIEALQVAKPDILQLQPFAVEWCRA